VGLVAGISNAVYLVAMHAIRREDQCSTPRVSSSSWWLRLAHSWLGTSDVLAASKGAIEPHLGGILFASLYAFSRAGETSTFRQTFAHLTSV